MSEDSLRQLIVRWGKSLFERGLTAGSSGNISVQTEQGDFLVTPTNSCLGFLDVGNISKLDADGQHISGDAPTKELPLHLAFYRVRRDCRAVVHLHSSYATALSCMSQLDTSNTIPPISPYVVMRVGKVPLIKYTRPGSHDVVLHIEANAADHTAVLLQNHGPVVSGTSLENAIFAIEELEEAAKLTLITHDMKIKLLNAQQIADINKHFKPR